MKKQNPYQKRIYKLIDKAVGKGTRLNLGCGEDYREGYINCDNHPNAKADRVIDLEEKLPFKDNYADTILLNGVLEHINKPLKLLAEIHRVLKKGGVVIIIMPHFTNCHYFSDLTHVRPASYQMFKLLCSKHFYQGINFREKKIKFMFSKNHLLWDYFIEPLANLFPNLYEYTPLRMFQCWDIYAEMVKR